MRSNQPIDHTKDSRLRILLADDHSLTRQVLHEILDRESRWIVIGEAADGQHAVELTKDLKPDMIVMDVAMPELNGIDAAREINRAAPEASILMVSNHVDVQLVRAALEAGAGGYISKQRAFEELIPALKSLESGQHYFGQQIPEFRSPDKPC